MRDTWLVAFVAFVAFAACSDGGAPPPSEGAWVVFTKLYSPEGETSYVGLTDLDVVEPSFDTSDAIEIAGIASFYAPTTGGYFGIGDSEDFSVTRYEATDGGLASVGRVSFAATGVTGYLGNTMAFLSATKAYYIDALQQLIVVWNPSTMEIEGEISLAELGRPGFSLDVSLFHYVVRDGRLLFTASWSNYDERSALPVTALVVIDTVNDRVDHVEETDRCAGALDLTIGPNGDAYFATNVYSIMDNAEVRGVSRPACVLRVRAGAETFDPEYLLPLADATGGRVAYGLTATNDPRRPYIWVLDEDLAPWAPEGEIDLYAAPAWRLWRLDLATGVASPDDAIPAGAAIAASVWYESAGRHFLVKPAADYATSQVFELSADGPVHRLSADGFVLGLSSVR